jgi:hypothetical protein
MIAPVGNKGTEPMTNDTQLLNDSELETVAGGASLIRTSTIVLPNIPRDKDLLTPQQIANLLSFNGTFNPPVPHG